MRQAFLENAHGELAYGDLAEDAQRSVVALMNFIRRFSEMGKMIRVKYASLKNMQRAAAAEQSSFEADELRVESALQAATPTLEFISGAKPVERVLKKKYAENFKQISKFEAVGAAAVDAQN